MYLPTLEKGPDSERRNTVAWEECLIKRGKQNPCLQIPGEKKRKRKPREGWCFLVVKVKEARGKSQKLHKEKSKEFPSVLRAYLPPLQPFEEQYKCLGDDFSPLWYFHSSRC